MPRFIITTTAMAPIRERWSIEADNHANPGGTCTIELGDGPVDDVLTKAFADLNAEIR